MSSSEFGPNDAAEMSTTTASSKFQPGKDQNFKINNTIQGGLVLRLEICKTLAGRFSLSAVFHTAQNAPHAYMSHAKPPFMPTLCF
jgi:hypothetical protein